MDLAALDSSAWLRHVAESWAPQIFLYAQEGPQVYARMFAPAFGIAEDPATARAAAALVAALASQAATAGQAAQIEITQGAAMGRLSRISARAIRIEAAVRVTIAGSSVSVGEGHISVPAKYFETHTH